MTQTGTMNHIHVLCMYTTLFVREMCLRICLKNFKFAFSHPTTPKVINYFTSTALYTSKCGSVAYGTLEIKIFKLVSHVQDVI